MGIHSKKMEAKFWRPLLQDKVVSAQGKGLVHHPMSVGFEKQSCRQAAGDSEGGKGETYKGATCRGPISTTP